MLKRVLTIFLSITLMLMGSYKRQIKPTDEYLNRRIQVFTKSGQSYTLVTYKITETSIIGKDREDRQHQSLIENIDKVYAISMLGSVEDIKLPPDEYLNKKIEIFTKSGQSYTLVTFKITETSIIGKDKEDKQHKVLIENVDKIYTISKRSSGEYIRWGVFLGIPIYVVIYGIIDFFSTDRLFGS